MRGAARSWALPLICATILTGCVSASLPPWDEIWEPSPAVDADPLAEAEIAEPTPSPVSARPVEDRIRLDLDWQAPRRPHFEEIGLTKDDTIFTTSARTVDFNGQALVPRVTYFQATGAYDGSHRTSDPLDRKLTVLATTLRGVWGIHEDLTLALTIPTLVKRLETTVAGRRLRLDAAGLGDTTAVAKWRFFKSPRQGGTTELAALLGIKAPTGRDDLRDGGMRLPRPLQPGSGSVDGILGTAFTHLWDAGRWLINADVIYKANTKADDYRFGNVLRFDVGGQYRVYPYRYERYDQLTVNLILELNGRYAEKDRTGGRRLGTTGGLKVFLSPGVQAILTENLLLEAGVQIPVHRDLNGPQLAEDLRITLGLRIRF